MEFLIILFVILYVRVVPKNTLLIIDKNSHYLKTKRKGLYLMFPSYEITTQISTQPLTRYLTDTYETDDGQAISITIMCVYHADDLDVVERNLANVRRSVDDVIKSSVYFAAGNYPRVSINMKSSTFSETLENNLINEFESLGIKLNKFIYYVNQTYTTKPCFKPHVSSSCAGGSSSTPHGHSDGGITTSKGYNQDGPITYC